MTLAACTSCDYRTPSAATTHCPSCHRPHVQRVTPRELLEAVHQLAEQEITRSGCTPIVRVPIPLSTVETIRTVLA